MGTGIKLIIDIVAVVIYLIALFVVVYSSYRLGYKNGSKNEKDNTINGYYGTYCNGTGHKGAEFVTGYTNPIPTKDKINL